MKMRAIRFGIVLAMALSLSYGSPLQAANRRAARPAPKSLPGSRSVIYKTIDDVELPIHIFEPDGHQPSDKRPAIVFFFGGGWASGSPAQFQYHCQYLASRGMVAMTAEYRVSSRHSVKAASCVADAKSAIRWVRLNAEKLGVDPRRIASGGGSAGGHLAAAVGTIDEFDEPGEDSAISSVPNAMMLFNPALVLAPIRDFSGGNWDRLADFQKRMGVEPERISPFHHVHPGQPPTIIFHGTDDKTVPYVTAELFTRKMNRLGNRCELASFAGQGHGFFNYGRSDNKYFAETVTKMDAFLISLGYLQGQADVEAFLEQGTL